MYRVSFDDLAKAGLDTSRLAGQSSGIQLPRLSHGDQVIPVLAWENSLIFYGQAPIERYASYRPYVLEANRDGTAIQIVPSSPAGLEVVPTTPFSQTFEQNQFYDGRPYAGLPQELALRQPWYWETIQVEAQVSIDFELPREPLGAATIVLDLVGVSSNGQVAEDHDLDVLVNGRRLKTIRWDGEAAVSAPISIPKGLLRQGTNTLILDNTPPGATPIDITRLDRFTVSYNAEPTAVDGLLRTGGVEGGLAISGFKDRPLLFDVSQPDAPHFLSEAEYNDGQVTLTMVEETRLVAVEPQALLKPRALLARGPAELTRSTNQADFIIISPAAFTSALEPLAAHRQAQGFSVRLVALEQIYQEFAEAGVGPAAISAFLAHAHDHWSPPRPAYLLLVGDASIDYRGYLSQPDPQSSHDSLTLLPAPIVPVTYSGETVSDARLADLDGDRRPDLAVGRWPVRDVDDVESLVRRTIDNEAAPVSPATVFAADGSEQRFADLNQWISQEAGLPQALSTFLSGPNRQEIGRAWSQGAWLVTYTGHGSLDRWGKDTLLDADAATALSPNGASPIVLQLTCLTGFFAHPTITSLSEEMLLAKNGPISIVAATSLTLSDHQRPFGVAFLQALQDPDISRVGDAFQRAKLDLDIESDDALREISDTFTLFGDPTALIPRADGQ